MIISSFIWTLFLLQCCVAVSWQNFEPRRQYRAHLARWEQAAPWNPVITDFTAATFFYCGNFLAAELILHPLQRFSNPRVGNQQSRRRGALYQDNCSARRWCCPAQNCQLANSTRVQCSLDFGDEYTVEQRGFCCNVFVFVSAGKSATTVQFKGDKYTLEQGGILQYYICILTILYLYSYLQGNQLL